MKVANEATPSDHELLMLASNLASMWVKGALTMLKECDQANTIQNHNSLALLVDFNHLERYVRTNVMPDVDSKKQEQFIRSLEMHWKCEVQNIECPSDLMLDNTAQSHLH